MDGQNHLREMQRLRGQCRHHSLYVQETGGGLRGSSTRISCQPQPEATSESRTLGISEVVGGSNASAHGELSSSRALGASQKIDNPQVPCPASMPQLSDGSR